MLKSFTLFILLLSVSYASAQITLTADYFPAAGDTLTYGVADSALQVDQLSPGAAREWDFDNPAALSTSTEVVTAANDLVFTEADVVTGVDGNTQAFYAISDTAYQLVGIRGRIDEASGQVFSAPISPGRSERRAPLEYQDRFQATTTNQLTIAADSIPEELIGDIDALGNVDTVRISATSNRQDVVDAYGTLTINGRTYDVLRERRTESVETKIEVRAGIVGYVDVTSVVLPFVPELADFIGSPESTTTYYYWSNTEKEAIAIVETDDTGMQTSMRFISADVTNSTNAPILTQAQVKVYPNPARNTATFEVTGLEAGDYRLRVVNVLGREVAQSIVPASGGAAKVDLDVSALPRGTYLYSLSNERGRILTTRRLLVGH